METVQWGKGAYGPYLYFLCTLYESKTAQKMVF